MIQRFYFTGKNGIFYGNFQKDNPGAELRRICGMLPFLNLMGGIGLMSNNYTDIGRALIISVVLLGLSLLLAFSGTG